MTLSQLGGFLALSAFAGIGIGLFLLYALLRFVYHDPNGVRTIVRLIVTRRPGAPPSGDSPQTPGEIQPSSTTAVPFDAAPAPAVEERLREGTLMSLVQELEWNRTATGELPGDDLVPLRTDAWDTSQRALRTLPPELRHDLDVVYRDINLLNHLAWLSTEFQLHSPSSREQYASLSANINARLDALVEGPLPQIAAASYED